MTGLCSYARRMDATSPDPSEKLDGIAYYLNKLADGPDRSISRELQDVAAELRTIAEEINADRNPQ